MLAGKEVWAQAQRTFTGELQAKLTRHRAGGKREAVEVIGIKACRRCRGDVFLDYDPSAGEIAVCLQCGHTRYPHAVSEDPPPDPPSDKRRKPFPRRSPLFV